RCLAALGIFLIALGEDRSGVGVVLPHIVGLAQPILGVAGERIVGMLLHEGAQRLLGRRVVGLAQQAERIVVLLLRRTAAGRRRRSSTGGRGPLVTADLPKHTRLARRLGRVGT